VSAAPQSSEARGHRHSHAPHGIANDQRAVRKLPRSKRSLQAAVYDGRTRLGALKLGERAAAGLKADQLVKQLGLRWPDIIAVERAPTTVAADGGEISWRAMLRVCHDCSDELSVKERGFIDTLSRWRGAPTPKQIKWLTGIYERLWGRPD